MGPPHTQARETVTQAGLPRMPPRVPQARVPQTQARVPQTQARLPHTPTRGVRGLGAPLRVSTLELFFDPVFAFTLTQLTARLASSGFTLASVAQLVRSGARELISQA